MSKYYETENAIYNLSGVLLHIGTSANGGHYVAHIKHQTTGQWFKFDDESVTELDINEVGSEKQNSKKKKPSATISSQNAYMLIYTNNQIDDYYTGGDPPAHITESVHLDNDNIDKEVLDFYQKLEDETKRINEERQFYEKVFKTIYTVNDYCWISTDWLRNWIAGNAEPIYNEIIKCEHGEISPFKIDQMKRISMEAWSLLYDRYSGDEFLNKENSCKQCIVKYCFDTSFNDKKEKKKTRYEKISKTSPEKWTILHLFRFS